jgi:hypothetical protein
LLCLASLAAFAPSFACSSDLDLSLEGRPCLNGACLRGYECVAEVCVAASGTSTGPVGVADSGGLIENKGSVTPDWGGALLVDGGALVPQVDASDTPRLDASVDAAIVPIGGTGGVQASGGSGGIEPPVEPLPPECTGALCDGNCVDLANDEAHCGSCNRVCASVELCVEGECVAECEPQGPLIDIGIDLGPADACPEACDACVDGRCEIHCESEQACKDREIDCPAGYACVIECSAKQACEKTKIECAAGELCSLRCAGEQACKEAELSCGGAHCELQCLEGVGACEKTRLRCGGGACRAICGEGQRKPTIEHCPDSCSTGCGCMEP